MHSFIAWNKDSFKHIYNMHFNGLCAFASKHLPDNVNSEDIVQEVFITLWKKRDDFNNLIAIKSFLYKSVRNKCLNILKHNSVIQKHEKELIIQLESDYYFKKNIIEEEAFNKLLHEICLLPKSCKNITMLALNGLKNAEIAEELEISINTVKTQKKIAFSKLRTKLSETICLFLMVF